MVTVAVLAFLALELGAGFGAASAESVSTTPNAVVVDLRVEVTGDIDNVIAHLTSPGHPEITIPLVERDTGVYGIRTEIAPIDYRIVFESLGSDAAQSPPVSLTALGADLGGGDVGVTTVADESATPSPAYENWLWLAVAFGAAALSALAFWVLGGDDQSGSDEGSSTGSEGEGDTAFLA